jgi:hypothetical protein
MLQRTLLAAFLGALLGWGVGWVEFYGYLTQWRPLPLTPVPITTIVHTYGDVVYAQATDGMLYICIVHGSSCWAQVPTSKLGDLSAQPQTTPCSNTAVAFSFTTAPPPTIRACLANEQIFADGVGTFLFALSDDRQIWYWQLIHSAHDRPLAIFTILGMLSGLLVVGMIVSLRATKRLLTQRQINHYE